MKNSSHASAQNLSFSVLHQDDIEKIHDLSLHILEKTGILIHYPPALQLLQAHGAHVKNESNLVFIPRDLVDRALETAPNSITLYSQFDSKKDCVLGPEDRQYARPATGLNWIIDANSKKRRPVTENDGVAYTRVSHALPYIHLVSSTYDQEGSPKAMEVRALNRMLRHSDKPLMVSAVCGEGMRWVQRMVEVVQSSDRRQRVQVLSSVSSPLNYGYGQVEAALVSAELGVTVAFNSSAVIGVSAPVTLAGSLALMNAEMLAALTIIQLHHPGAPVIYAGHPMVMDMSSGLARMSGSEVGLVSAACVDIGRFYGLPTGSNGLGSDSCSPDAMAVTNKWACGYLPIMARANISGGAGSLGSQSTICLEQLVIDNDIFGNILRHRQGIMINEDTLAGELIKNVGPGGSFIAEDHTLQYFRSELWHSPLVNNLNAISWEQAGSKEVLERATETVNSIINSPQLSLLHTEQDTELNKILVKAEEALEQVEVPA